MVSVTITDKSGRTLSGQTVEAFWNSVSHAPLLSVGINCALGAKEMRPYVEELSGLAPVFMSAYPNAGLPNAFGGFDETPEIMAPTSREFARDGLGERRGRLLRDDARRTSARSPRPCSGVPPRARPARSRARRGSRGLEPFTLRADGDFTVVGERTNVTGSPKFAKLVLAGDYEGALAVARQQVEGGANVLDVNMDEGMLDGAAAMTRFLNLLSAEPDIAKLPIMLDSSKWDVIEAGLKCLQGKAVVNSISLKEGEEAFRAHARLVRRYGAAVDRDGVRRGGPGDDRRAEGRDRRARLPDPHGGGRLPARGHHLRPERPHGRDGHRGARRLRASTFIEATRRIKAALPFAKVSRRDLERLVLVPRQQRRPRGDARGVPLPRDPGRPRHGHRQRRPARGLRGDPEGPPRAGRGRPPEPPARRDRAARRVRRVREAGRARAEAEGRRLAERHGRGAPRARARPRASPTSSRPTPRRRARSSAGRSPSSRGR